MEVKINREIRNYTESMFFGLSMRQFVFSVLAILVAVGLYFLLKPHFGTETVSWMCILGAAPFAALGFITYHGMTAEQFLWAWLRSELLEPKELRFESSNLYQRCANRKQIETICVNFLRGMEATKLSVTGHMYFVPRTFMERVDIFEDFITLLSGLNKKQTPLVVNSFYIIDDAKQRDKMTEEFYLAVKKEIATYQEKCDYLIKSSSQSPAVMERWVLKVQALEEKKRHYEGVLQRELDGLDDEFSVLKLLSQELQVRARSIRSQRFQQRAA